MRSARFLAPAVVLIAALTTGRGQAGPIRWSYEWNAHPIVVNAQAANPNAPPPGGITLIPGAITITGGSQGETQGSATIVAVNLATFSFSPDPSGEPDRFHNAPYTLAVNLRDIDSGQTRSLSFKGEFDGSMTDSSVDLQTRFTSPTQQSTAIGHNIYTVTMTSYTPPGPPSVGNQGEIRALVDVHPLGVPEPSGLFLGGVALLGASLSRLSRRLRRCTHSTPELTLT
jgi:hypothetical protein